MTKWIFFDVGGTLVDETASIRRRVRLTVELQRSPGQEYTEEELLLAMEASAKKGASYFRGAMKAIGISAYAPYDCIGEVLFPETKKTLEALAGRYRLGIIANQPRGTEKRLYEYGIGHLFSLVISSEEEGVEKPAAEIFFRALKRAGCAAEEAYMVGDRPDNDIAPAKALGMKTVRIAQGLGGMMPVLGEEMRAEHEIRSLSELLVIL